MKIIFLGNVVPICEIKKYSAGSVAGNKMQYYLLKHLNEFEDLEIEVVSFFCHASFPKDKKLFIKGSNDILFNRIKIHQLSYINLPIIKQLILMQKIFKKVKKICSNNSNSIVFSYDLYPVFGNTLRKIKEKRRICLLADLSIGGVQKSNGIKRFLQYLYDRQTLKNLRCCQNYIVLNENVVKKISHNCNYIVVQGGVEPDEYPSDFEENKWNGKTKNVLYTGALVEYSGILTLIHAMKFLEDTDIVLDIYGTGPLEKIVTEYSKKNRNVRYFGSLTNDKILKEQRKAWILINPRPIENSISKVTFPSKIFEYMMSKRPILSTKLNGFTEIYNDKIIWIYDDTETGMAKKIKCMLEYSNKELNLIAEKAYDFVIKNKTWKQNSKIIYDFLIKIK